MITTTNLQILSERAVEGLLHGFKCEATTSPLGAGFIISFRSSIEISGALMSSRSENEFFKEIKKQLQEKLNGTVFINETINDLNRQIEMLESVIAKHNKKITMLEDRNVGLEKYASFYELTRQLKNQGD